MVGVIHTALTSTEAEPATDARAEKLKSDLESIQQKIADREKELEGMKATLAQREEEVEANN
jgi:septal ring factor EnvC (AmiA/AmiB activator)